MIARLALSRRESRYNGSGPRGAGNTGSGLTRSLDHSKRIGVLFGVHPHTVGHICRGATWAHIEDDPAVTPPAARDLITVLAESLGVAA